MRLDRFTNKIPASARRRPVSCSPGTAISLLNPCAFYCLHFCIRKAGRCVRYWHLPEADIAQLNQKIDDTISRFTAGGKVPPRDVQPSQDLIRHLNICDQIAQKQNDAYIASEIFILAVA